MAMSRIRRAFGADAGFSLTELIIVVGLLPLVLAGAWGALQYTTASNAVATTQGNAARDFSDPMEQMSSILMQNTTIHSATPNRLEVWTDRHMDGSPELQAFYVTADNRLVYETWNYNSSRTTILAHRSWDLSTTNYNIAAGTPLFSYSDKDNVVIQAANVPATAPSDATSVRVTLILDMGRGRTASDVREILFRNRN